MNTYIHEAEDHSAVSFDEFLVDDFVRVRSPEGPETVRVYFYLGGRARGDDVWHGRQKGLTNELVPGPWRGVRDAIHKSTVPTGFIAHSTNELIEELHQRTVLAQLRAENERLREQVRRRASSQRRVQPAPSTEVHGFVLPPELTHFAPIIERSREMLQLEDNWDGEGTCGYAEDTWRRAVGIALKSAKSFALLKHHERVPAPAITKGPEGGVAIIWRWNSKQLMIEVSADADEPVTYHGYDRECPSRETKGTLHLADDNEWILSWLNQ